MPKMSLPAWGVRVEIRSARLLMRGVTPQRLPASQICRISTRTPHAGSDELSCMFSA